MRKTLSLIGYLGMMAALAWLVLTRRFFSASPFVIAPQVLAVVLMIWARLTFGLRSFHAIANPTEGGLVTSGPYRFVRHPIYTAVCLLSLPGVFAHWSWLSALLGATVVSCALLRMLQEEKLLTVRYPEYLQYAAHTSRMIPGLF